MAEAAVEILVPGKPLPLVRPPKQAVLFRLYRPPYAALFGRIPGLVSMSTKAGPGALTTRCAHLIQEGELLSFSTQAQTRRESLTGRPELKGTALVNNAQPAHQNQPSLRSIVEEAELPSHSHSRLTAAAAAAVVALAAPREAVVASTQPSATTQPQQQTLAAPPASLAYDRFDPHSSQDDDACTAALGAAIGSSSREHIVSLPAGAPSSSKVVKLASEIFEDQGLKKLVTDVLHKQLQRTKDGATDKSRIHELAGATNFVTCLSGTYPFNVP